MLDVLRRGRRWGTAAIILAVGGVFVAYIGLGGPMQCARSAAVVDVDGRAVGRDEFLRVRANQEDYLRELAGDAFDPRAASEYLDHATAGAIVSRSILAAEAERLGVQVSREELRQTVLSIPGLRDPTTGRLDRDAYERFYSHEYGSEGELVDELRRQLLVQKMVQVVAAGAHVSEGEARDAALYRGQEVRIGFVAFEPGGGVDPAELAEDEVAAWAAAHEERIATRYAERKSDFEHQEAVRARHLLFQLASDATEEQVAEVRARAEQALTRLREGGDFAALAKELSDDGATRERGGDLGWIGRGQMVPAFEEAAFALEAGGLSKPVRTEFGLHLIRVEEKRASGERPLAEVRLELARELLAAERSAELARTGAEQLRAAIEQGQGLEAAARSQGLTVERTDWLRRSPDGLIPGLGASLPVQAVIFALKTEGESLARVFDVDGKLALVAMLERREPDAETLAKATVAERERLLEERRSQLVQTWVDARRRRLEADGRVLVNLAALEQQR